MVSAFKLLSGLELVPAWVSIHRQQTLAEEGGVWIGDTDQGESGVDVALKGFLVSGSVMAAVVCAVKLVHSYPVAGIQAIA